MDLPALIEEDYALFIDQGDDEIKEAKMVIIPNSSSSDSDNKLNTKHCYDKEWFVPSEATKSYECGICHEIIKNCRELNQCGHLFGADCINPWIKRGMDDISRTFSCPICRKSYPRQADSQISLAADRMILGRKVYCRNKKKGCSAIMTLKDRIVPSKTSHDTKCLFEIIQCDDCKMKIMRRDLGTHKQIHCEERLVSCQLCREKIKLTLLEKHKDMICSENWVHCPNECYKLEQTEEEEEKELEPIPEKEDEMETEKEADKEQEAEKEQEDETATEKEGEKEQDETATEKEAEKEQDEETKENELEKDEKGDEDEQEKKQEYTEDVTELETKDSEEQKHSDSDKEDGEEQKERETKNDDDAEERDDDENMVTELEGEQKKIEHEADEEWKESGKSKYCSDQEGEKKEPNICKKRKRDSEEEEEDEPQKTSSEHKVNVDQVKFQSKRSKHGELKQKQAFKIPTFLRKNLPKHLEVCPLQLIPCRYKDSIGCDIVMQRNKIKQHEDPLLHFDLLVKDHLRLKQAMSEFKKDQKDIVPYLMIFGGYEKSDAKQIPMGSILQYNLNTNEWIDCHQIIKGYIGGNIVCLNKPYETITELMIAKSVNGNKDIEIKQYLLYSNWTSSSEAKFQNFFLYSQTQFKGNAIFLIKHNSKTGLWMYVQSRNKPTLSCMDDKTCNTRLIRGDIDAVQIATVGNRIYLVESIPINDSKIPNQPKFQVLRTEPIYDRVNRKWIIRKWEPCAVAGYLATEPDYKKFKLVALENKLYMIGGTYVTREPGVGIFEAASSKVLCYDTILDKWQPLAFLKHARINSCVVALPPNDQFPGGAIYVIGGNQTRIHYSEDDGQSRVVGSSSNTIDCYNPVNNTWKVLESARLPQFRQSFHAAIVWKNKECA